MKGKIIITAALISMFAFSGFVVSAVELNENIEKPNQAITLDGNQLGFLERLRNRIRDTLGICAGECKELVEISGVLTYDGAYFYVDEVEVHFGPVWYISKTDSAIDYDNDGELELIIDELYGLVGETVTLKGYMQSDNWFSVFIINGEAYRDIGKPVWSGGTGGHHGNGPGG